MGFFDFIKRLFKREKLDSDIEVSTGRAVCKICDKILDGEVYSVKGIRGYYCKKHAKEIAQGKIFPLQEHDKHTKTEHITTRKNIRRPYSGQCEFQGCHNKPTGLDVYFCRYCEEYHCPKHRIAEDHECIGNPKSLEKKGVASYSRR